MDKDIIFQELNRSYELSCSMVKNIESRKESKEEIYEDYSWVRLMQIKTSVEKVYNEIFSHPALKEL
tara:strand:+ start:1295 stop:1495 length:201 start_codon:yes stop_codon:yes gene_type:complete